MAAKKKTRQIVAIGGGSLCSEGSEQRLARYLLGVSPKKRPRVCFLPTASGDAPEQVVHFHECFDRLECRAVSLLLFRRTVSDLRAFLLGQDVIVVGPGSTPNLLSVWRTHGVDQILKEALDSGIILSGTGAGALCWFETGVTTSFGSEPQVFRGGLGFIKGSFCPHADSEPERCQAFLNAIQVGALPPGYAADDEVALRFTDGRLAEAVAAHVRSKARYCEPGADRLEATAVLCKLPELKPDSSPGEKAPGAATESVTVVYSDGACSGNPGPGGWAWAVRGGRFASGAEPRTTNQRMEIRAAFEAVKALEGPVEVVSDSTYVVNCFRQRWWQTWLKRGWVNSQNKPVANRDLWEPFIHLVRERGNVSFRWVKGHSSDPMNDLVDRLAVEAGRTGKGRSGSAPRR